MNNPKKVYLRNSKRPFLKKSETTTKCSDTSWGKVAKEYHSIVGSDGHFYHREVILPNIQTFIDISSKDFFIDIGCGQGVFEKILPKNSKYLGIDISKELVKLAERSKISPKHEFVVADLTKPELPQKTQAHFESASKAVAILSLQNMTNPEVAISHASKLLNNNGLFVIILNHPCFRIPRLSSWQYDENQGLMYRRVDRYLSKQKIPIQNNPGRKHSALTWSFHFPLSFWITALKDCGFHLVDMEEWTSPKQSYGKRGKAENLARKEFPLFLALKAQKIRH
ncbi:class I SAM-dependent methyltransferase [Chlamydiifrater phoenicopteri]|uniref:class I SAM-dependent methyltransferase n=1 Tax=Chlamydiifrater phoenicopteri TaxID=2681469 RepID=UPI001BCDA8AC|nr:class I SAM-dependent methyltransferase [Chlamydiifrater phoenicopteri]